LVQFAVNVGPVRCQHWLRVQFAVNAGRERRCALSPPSPYPCQPSNLPPGSPLSIEGAVRAGAKMGGDGSTSGESQQHNATCLTATPSTASRQPPPLCSVTSHLPELYRKCVEEGGLARVLYNANGGMEKLTSIRKIQPVPNVPAPPQLCNLDARLSSGGMHEIEEGGMRGLRGGLTAPSPAPHPLCRGRQHCHSRACYRRSCRPSRSYLSIAPGAACLTTTADSVATGCVAAAGPPPQKWQKPTERQPAPVAVLR
jgi:hypothetical protein